MMQKMGWSGKGGLGKDEKGIAAPLEHRKTGRNVGSIVMSEECQCGSPSMVPFQVGEQTLPRAAG